ncbi:hypothetical protein K493DRAFT_320249 [Basidiobolus meristosporus CBS 931.73]|uniref:Arrestin C-terminal-like domain-containing protein n=1 Tax=Basidiobolus meristosporus CBS 931.73 TaxID=1314790 RepID=A0A1Y1XCK0_9FUNG|nr:hypothetical protein K493DRAFT_320249 [Basidiobolus meristosporus CBS 931.73]|eukprot:ORX83511.1 hypothetical protein K493DRAFT_320249 [Basidiobolus meristosporus CBS 931.73]
MFSSSSVSITLQSDSLYTSPYLGLEEQRMSLRGTVTFDSSTILKVKRLYLNFDGKLSMQFPGCIKKTRRNIIDLSVTLFEHQKAVPLSGRHIFPFEILVPNDLPESFRGEFGKIRYTLKAIAETTFLGSGLKSKVPIHVQRNIDTLDEVPDENTTEQSLPNKISCKVMLPTTKYTPGEKFDVLVSGEALDPEVKVTNVACTLKQYVHFHIPSRSDQRRVSVAEYMKRLSFTSTPLNSNNHSKTLLMAIPESAILHCINPLVEVMHNLVVRFDWELENGQKDSTTLTIPLEIVASIGQSELDQLPMYTLAELPPSYCTLPSASDTPPSYYLPSN